MKTAKEKLTEAIEKFQKSFTPDEADSIQKIQVIQDAEENTIDVVVFYKFEEDYEWIWFPLMLLIRDTSILECFSFGDIRLFDNVDKSKTITLYNVEDWVMTAKEKAKQIYDLYCEIIVDFADDSK